MQKTNKSKSRRRAIGVKQQKMLCTLVRTNGQAKTAHRLGISMSTLASLAAGFIANGSTVELIEYKLLDIEQGSKGPA